MSLLLLLRGATATGAITGTATLTFAPTATVSGGAATSGTAALTFSPTATAGGSAAASGTTALVFAPSATPTGRAAASGTTALTFTLSLFTSVTADLATGSWVVPTGVCTP